MDTNKFIYQITFKKDSQWCVLFIKSVKKVKNNILVLVLVRIIIKDVLSAKFNNITIEVYSTQVNVKH